MSFYDESWSAVRNRGIYLKFLIRCESGAAAFLTRVGSGLGIRFGFGKGLGSAMGNVRRTVNDTGKHACCRRACCRITIFLSRCRRHRFPMIFVSQFGVLAVLSAVKLCRNAPTVLGLSLIHI